MLGLLLSAIAVITLPIMFKEKFADNRMPIYLANISQNRYSRDKWVTPLMDFIQFYVSLEFIKCIKRSRGNAVVGRMGQKTMKTLFGSWPIQKEGHDLLFPHPVADNLKTAEHGNPFPSILCVLPTPTIAMHSTTLLISMDVTKELKKNWTVCWLCLLYSDRSVLLLS
jgi:hypothetical protein